MFIRQQPHVSCHSCGAEFVSQELLAEHLSNVHPEPSGAATCAVCGVNLGDANDLDEHLRHEHGVDVADTVPCLECGLVFAGADALEEHMDQEHPERAGMGGAPSRS